MEPDIPSMYSSLRSKTTDLKGKLPTLGQKYYLCMTLISALVPVSQMVVDMWALVEYIKKGELQGLVSPHRTTAILYGLFCGLGVIWTCWISAYNLSVFLHVRKTSCR